MRVPNTVSWGLGLALLTALISGLSVFLNGRFVKLFDDPTLLAAVRNGLVGLILLGLAVGSGGLGAIRTLDWRRRGWLIAVGVIGGGLSFALFFNGLADMFQVPWRITRLATQSIKQGLTFFGFQRQQSSPAAPFQAPRTSFNTELTPHRRFTFASVPLDDVKSIRWAFDVKVNDVILALVSGALRRYLQSRDELPRAPLIAQVPVSLRGDDDKSDVGTKVGAMFASLATNVGSPALRLLAINDSTKGAKEMQRALAAELKLRIPWTAADS